jgi:hypothetical protein
VLVRLADHGVEAEFLQELSALHLVDLTVDEIVDMVDHGVDPEFVAKTRAAVGY